MKKYKVSWFYAIPIYLFAPVLIWATIFVLSKTGYSSGENLLLILILSLSIIGLIIAIIYAYRGKVIITETEIISTGYILARKIKINEIKGYKSSIRHIIIMPNNNNEKHILIAEYIGGFDEIIDWLSERFPDLDEKEGKQDLEEALQDKNFGPNKEVRTENLSKAKNIALTINLTVIVTTAWLFIYPKPYEYIMLMATVIPIVTIFTVLFSKGLIRFFSKGRGGRPGLDLALLVPACGIGFRSFNDYDIFNYESVWLPIGIMTTVFLLVIFLKQKEILRKNKKHFIAIGLLSTVFISYAFGTVIHYNCYYDKSEPQHYTVKVLEKIKSGGSDETYDLRLFPWGPQKKINKIRVGSDLFNRTKKGEKVNIYFYPGNFDIPWYIVSDE